MQSATPSAAATEIDAWCRPRFHLRCHGDRGRWTLRCLIDDAGGVGQFNGQQMQLALLALPAVCLSV